MTYDLWDTLSGNIIDTYDTEGQALAMVLDLIEVNGETFAEALSLGYEAEDGSMGIIAVGRRLAVRARAAIVPAVPEPGS